MEERITVIELRDQLNKLIEEGKQDRFISVGEYYLTKTINNGDEDDGDIWNSVYIGEGFLEDYPLTQEQQEWIDKNAPESDEFMDFDWK